MKLFLFALLLFTTFSIAQTTPDKTVDIQVHTVTENIKPGSNVEVDLILNIKDGWHINANKPFDKNLIPTIVTIKDSIDFKVERIEYPPAIVMNLAFSEDELALYEEEAVIKVFITIDKKYKKGRIILTGNVQYQPCNDQTCLFPFTKPFSVELKLSKK